MKLPYNKQSNLKVNEEKGAQEKIIPHFEEPWSDLCPLGQGLHSERSAVEKVFAGQSLQTSPLLLVPGVHLTQLIVSPAVDNLYPLLHLHSRPSAMASFGHVAMHVKEFPSILNVKFLHLSQALGSFD